MENKSTKDIEHNWEDISSTCMVSAIIALGFFAAFSLIWIIINRGITTRYTVNNEAAVQESF